MTGAKITHVILRLPLCLNSDLILEFKDYCYRILLCNANSLDCIRENKNMPLWENKRD